MYNKQYMDDLQQIILDHMTCSHMTIFMNNKQYIYNYETHMTIKTIHDHDMWVT